MEQILKIDKLTPEQEARLPEIRQRMMDKFLTYAPIDMDKARQVIDFVYSLIGEKPPRIHLVISPKEAQALANKLDGKKDNKYEFGTFLTQKWASFYAFYEVFVEFGVLTEQNSEKYFKLRPFIDSNIFATIEFDTDIILVEKPQFIKKIMAGDTPRMHCLDGPAVLWKDGYAQYYINGRAMPEWIFTKNLTKEDFINEENEDIKAGIYEVVEARKEGAMMELLGAEIVDTRTFVHKNGELEEMTLYKTKDTFEEETDLTGKSGVPLAWVRMQCPSTGTNYLIPTDSSFKTCEEAAKFARPDGVPDDIDYSWDTRS